MPGWVTVFGRVNHLGTEPGIQAYQPDPALCGQTGMSTRRKLGKKTGTSCDTSARTHGLAVWC